MHHPLTFCFSLFDDLQIVGIVVQNLTAVLSDHDQILHIYTELTGNGNARLNGEYIAGLSQILVCRRISVCPLMAMLSWTSTASWILWI